MRSREELFEQPLFWVVCGVGLGFLVTRVGGGGQAAPGPPAPRSEPAPGLNPAGQILQICDTCTPVRPILEDWASGTVPSPAQLVNFAKRV